MSSKETRAVRTSPRRRKPVKQFTPSSEPLKKTCSKVPVVPLPEPHGNEYIIQEPSLKEQSKVSCGTCPLPDAEGFYFAEDIVSRRLNSRGEWMFRIRYKGYGPLDDTWEPYHNCSEFLKYIIHQRYTCKNRHYKLTTKICPEQQEKVIEEMKKCRVATNKKNERCRRLGLALNSEEGLGESENEDENEDQINSVFFDKDWNPDEVDDLEIPDLDLYFGEFDSSNGKEIGDITTPLPSTPNKIGIMRPPSSICRGKRLFPNPSTKGCANCNAIGTSKGEFTRTNDTTMKLPTPSLCPPMRSQGKILRPDGRLMYSNHATTTSNVMHGQSGGKAKNHRMKPQLLATRGSVSRTNPLNRSPALQLWGDDGSISPNTKRKDSCLQNSTPLNKLQRHDMDDVCDSTCEKIKTDIHNEINELQKILQNMAISSIKIGGNKDLNNGLSFLKELQSFRFVIENDTLDLLNATSIKNSTVVSTTTENEANYRTQESMFNQMKALSNRNEGVEGEEFHENYANCEEEGDDAERDFCFRNDVTKHDYKNGIRSTDTVTLSSNEDQQASEGIVYDLTNGLDDISEEEVLDQFTEVLQTIAPYRLKTDPDREGLCEEANYTSTRSIVSDMYESDENAFYGMLDNYDDDDDDDDDDVNGGYVTQPEESDDDESIRFGTLGDVSECGQITIEDISF